MSYDDEIVQWLRSAADEYGMGRCEEAADEIERLRAECFSLAAWQCVYTDGKTGLVGDEHGNQYCAMTKEVENLRAGNRDLQLHWDVLRSDYEKVCAHNAELVAALTLGAEMRTAQLAYFKSRNREELIASKTAETKFDKAARAALAKIETPTASAAENTDDR